MNAEGIQFFVPVVGTKFTLTEDWTTLVPFSVISKKFTSLFYTEEQSNVINEARSKNVLAWNDGVPVTFVKGTIFQVTKYFTKGISRIDLKVLWSPTKPKQTSFLCAVWFFIANFNPKCTVISEPQRKSFNLLKPEKADVLRHSNIDSGRVFVEISEEGKKRGYEDQWATTSLRTTWKPGGRVFLMEVRLQEYSGYFTLELPIKTHNDFELKNVELTLIPSKINLTVTLYDFKSVL